MPTLKEIEQMRERYIWKKNPKCECGHRYREHKDRKCQKCRCRFFSDKNIFKEIVKLIKVTEKAYKKADKSNLRFGEVR